MASFPVCLPAREFSGPSVPSCTALSGAQSLSPYPVKSGSLLGTLTHQLQYPAENDFIHRGTSPLFPSPLGQDHNEAAVS